LQAGFVIFVDVSVNWKSVFFFFPLVGLTVKFATGAGQLTLGAAVGDGDGDAEPLAEADALGDALGVGDGLGVGVGVGVDTGAVTGVIVIVATALPTSVRFCPPVNTAMNGVKSEK
jgi:hypothetical protein